MISKKAIDPPFSGSGHQKWVDTLPTLTEITKLGGWNGMVPSEQYTLEK